MKSSSCARHPFTQPQILRTSVPAMGRGHSNLNQILAQSSRPTPPACNTTNTLDKERKKSNHLKT